MGNGIRCSVKNCHNRHSKNLSFFGYPSDLTLRKIWIENCGLGVDPIEKIINKVRVCRVHFENDCFKNSEKKNRLRPEAVPTLFLGVGKKNINNIFLIFIILLILKLQYYNNTVKVCVRFFF